MRQRRGLERVGAALGVAGGFWVASAFAQGVDAGDTDAGLPGKVGPLPAGTLVYPPAGATDVVLNTGLILRVEEVVLDPLSAGRLASGRSALGEGLLLRDDSGQLIATGEMVISPTVRPSIAPLLAAADVEISTAPLVLWPETHYRVLSRVAVCTGEEGAARSVCLQNEFVEIADFTTGTESDRAGTDDRIDRARTEPRWMLAGIVGSSLG
jgi:hypothetical protein